MIKIVADKNIPFLKGVLEPFAKVEYYRGDQINNTILGDADCLIIRTRTICNQKLLKNTNVKFIASATIGFDHIDRNYCSANNIKWTNAPGCNSGSVMQYVASALMFLAEKCNFDFMDKILGVIGVGNVGGKVEMLAKALGMSVLLNDPPRERNEKKKTFVSLRQICNQADIISFHVPLNHAGIDKTYHIADSGFFSSLKQKPFIINTSRGEVIERQSLKKALKNRQIAGAVIDVWENEPQIDTALVELTDIATPHIAGYSLDGKANGTSMVVNAVSDFFNFNLNNWRPEFIPKPNYPQIKIEDFNAEMNQIIKQAVFQTYNIKNDDKRLRFDVNSFEKQRSEYPKRREFNAYNIDFKELDDNALKIIVKKIGFIVT